MMMMTAKAVELESVAADSVLGISQTMPGPRQFYYLRTGRKEQNYDNLGWSVLVSAHGALCAI